MYIYIYIYIVYRENVLLKEQNKTDNRSNLGVVFDALLWKEL